MNKLKHKKKGRLRGPQPKTTCEFCGRKLSQQALKRHTGTSNCTDNYWARKLRAKYHCPPGYLLLEGVGIDVAHVLIKQADITPDVSPVRKAIIWDDPVPLYNYDNGPILQYIAPTWLVIALGFVAELRYARDELDAAIQGGWHAGTKNQKKVEFDFKVNAKKLDIVEQDMVTLLQHMQGNVEDALALSTELELVARDTTRKGNVYDFESVSEVLRQWASELVDNL